MSDPFAAPRHDTAMPGEPLPWVGYAQITLWVVGGLYVLLGVVLGPLYGSLFFIESGPEAVVFPVVGVFMFVMCAGFGAINVAAAVGLAREAKWAWFATVIIGAIYAGSACLPFGAVLLYAMLQEDARKRFLG